MAPPGQSFRSLTLFQLIPRNGIRLKHGKRRMVMNKHDDQLVVIAFRRALSTYPTMADGGRLFERLLDAVVFYRFRRLVYGRRAFWIKVADTWKMTTGVTLDYNVVRALVLTITLGERHWRGEKRKAQRPFLQRVREMNDYFVRFEYHSDEASELIEEEKEAAAAPNSFTGLHTYQIRWKSMNAPDTSVIETALQNFHLYNEPETTDAEETRDTLDTPNLKKEDVAMLRGEVTALLEELKHYNDDVIPKKKSASKNQKKKERNKKKKEREAAEKKEQEEEEAEEMELDVETDKQEEDSEEELEKWCAAEFEKDGYDNEDSGQEEDDHPADQAIADAGAQKNLDTDNIMTADEITQTEQAQIKAVAQQSNSKGKKRGPSPEQDEHPSAKRAKLMPTIPVITNWPIPRSDSE